jgi:alpha-glucosidase
MPWSGHVPPFGFSADGIEPWLPQPADWAALTVEAQLADPGSMLSLVRRAVHLRRELTASDGDLAWSPSGSGVLDFTRGAALRCVVNFSSTPIPLDPSWSVVVASNAVDGGLLPPDSTAWLTR